MPLCLVKNFLTLKYGTPIPIPSALASSERDTTQPSLLDSTITGLLANSGWRRRSQETKKLLQSTSAKFTKIEYPKNKRKTSGCWGSKMGVI